MNGNPRNRSLIMPTFTSPWAFLLFGFSIGFTVASAMHVIVFQSGALWRNFTDAS